MQHSRNSNKHDDRQFSAALVGCQWVIQDPDQTSQEITPKFLSILYKQETGRMDF
jgi:hypothetical protein